MDISQIWIKIKIIHIWIISKNFKDNNKVIINICNLICNKDLEVKEVEIITKVINNIWKMELINKVDKLTLRNNNKIKLNEFRNEFFHF